jgi:hypothetical protein
MSRKARMINTGTLDNPERSLTLVDRTDEPAAAEVAAADHAAAELRVLRARISALKLAGPKDSQPHCKACFVRGVSATLRALDED